MTAGHTAEVLFTSKNAAQIYWLEASVINALYDDFNCLNVAKEDPMLSLGKSIKEYATIDDFKNDLEDNNR